jgi:pimeloyl-ACP methyl ester carboxylesterase
MHRSLCRIVVLLLLVTGAAAGRASAQTALVGRWEGRITVLGSQLGFSISVTQSGATLKGTMDVPQQGAAGIPLKTVTLDGTKVKLEMSGPSPAVMDGELKDDVISGKFEQAGIVGSFELKRAAAAAEPAAPAKAPEPLPYKEEDVKYQAGTVTLAGTLTIPPSKGPHPAVILITGSGAQNRDEEIVGFKVFRVIADALTRRGIAVLRVDDRGVGGSTGNTAQSTTSDFADDVMAGVRWLKNRPDINTSKIGLMGHSEGGVIAPMVAARIPADIAFIVLMSGTGLKGEAILLSQSELLGRAAGRTPEQITRNQEIQKTMFSAVRTNTGWDTVDTMLRAEIKASLDAMPEAQRQAIGDPDKFIQAQISGQVDRVKTPWFRYFLDLDPAVALEKVKCPTLVLFGERDLQVEAAPNRAAVEKAFAKSGFKKFRIELLLKANHLYQEANTGGVNEYAILKKEFVPGFLDLVGGWIATQTGLVTK